MRLAFRPRPGGGADLELIWAGIGLALVAGALIAARMEWPGVGCPFRALTGWPCATCGTTRAALALGGGRLVDAFAVSPLPATIAVAWAAWSAWIVAGLALPLPRPRVLLTRAWEAAALRALAVTALLANWAWLLATDR